MREGLRQVKVYDMEHLPKPRNSIPHIRVPYLNGPEYDDLDFATFPQRMGWDEEKIGYPGLVSITGRFRHDEEALLQSWLFFGTLSSLFKMWGLGFKMVDYLRGEDDAFLKTVPSSPNIDSVTTITAYLSTAHLWNHLDEARDRECSLPKTLQQEHWEKMLEILNKTGRVCERAEYSSPDARGSFLMGKRKSWEITSLYPESELAIEILRSTLFCWGTKTYQEQYDRSVISGVFPKFLVLQMMEDGWCPNHLAHLLSVTEPSILYFLYLMGKPKRSTDHNLCTTVKCEWATLDVASYTTKHLCAAGSCNFVEPSVQKMQSILDQGSFPLVAIKWSSEYEYDSRVAPDGPPTMQIDVVPFEEGMKFTAISHVWADGHGNLNTNALPSCTLHHIGRLSSVLVFGGSIEQSRDGWLYLWIDTLCVPLQSLESRKKAIMLMGETYRKAETVLVMDQGLQETHLRETSAQELLVRICTSNWRRRLWTLQEGSLNENVLFLFREGAASMLNLARELCQTPDLRAFETPIGLYCIRSVANWQLQHMDWKDDFADRFYHIVRLVRSRSTSVASDEPLCLATLLNLPLASMLNATDENRMRQFYLGLGHISPRVIFAPGARLVLPGFRWALDSFMTMDSQLMISSTLCYSQYKLQPAKITSQGLDDCTYSALIIIRVPGRRIGSTLWLRTPVSWYPARLHGSISIESFNLAPHSLLALIPKPEIDYAPTAVLVGDCKPSNGKITGRYLCQVDYGLWKADESKWRHRFEGVDDLKWEDALWELVGKPSGEEEDMKWTRALWVQNANWCIT